MAKYIIIDMNMPDEPTAKIWAMESESVLSVSWNNPDVKSIITNNALHTYRSGDAFLDSVKIHEIYTRICTGEKEVSAIKVIIDTMKEIGNEN